MSLHEPKDHHRGLHALAIFEAVKALIVLLAGFGLTAFLHHHAQHVAQRIVSALHLNPDHHYPRVFIELGRNFDNSRLWLLATFAAAYSAIHFIEAYGLWRQRRWGEWLGLIGAGIYLPFEIYELFHGATPIKWIVFATNVLIVVYLGRVLLEKPAAKHAATDAD